MAAIPWNVSADYRDDAISALIVADCHAAAQAAEEALRAAAVRIAARVSVAEASERLALQAHVDLILVESEAVDDAALELLLEDVEAAATALNAVLIVTLQPEQIDLVSARLEPGRAELLCTPSLVERLGALAVARMRTSAGRQQRVESTPHERESARLRRLSEELIRIAEAFDHPVRGGNNNGGFGVNEAGMTFRGQDAASLPEVDANDVRLAIRERRLREQFLDAALFSDPAWDMLLDLFAAELAQRRVSVSSLCIAAMVPSTTALRWIATMHEQGLFVRQTDPADRRRVHITLSPKASEAMRRYFGAVKQAGKSLT